ncbi:LOW QUALITY PROTEIN: acyl-CoA synthetase short-chain family member 3, mitochondrial [Hetaerina americana]|uniref:LOW QUALITY PROTEIN: acyl-CoA synthetase short-chain family member 3, mitochondrial n=1 Tax=Hetaerina americana TaxID=62018 RepID=UPI003A7F4614
MQMRLETSRIWNGYGCHFGHSRMTINDRRAIQLSRNDFTPTCTYVQPDSSENFDKVFEFQNHDVLKQERGESEYDKAFKLSLENPPEFWAEVGHKLSWYKPWNKVLDDSDPPFTKWFVGGMLNACYNAVDRHVENGFGERLALIHDSPVTSSIRRITYSQLLEKVSLLAGVYSKIGVKKGDRVLIYMPMIPEAIISMLAAARLGAIHSVVFGGFAARELQTRIEHAEPTVIVAANCGVEPNKIVHYRSILKEALLHSAFKPSHLIIYERPEIKLDGDKYEHTFEDVITELDWEESLKTASHQECIPVEANEALYILYTSGTTDQPKGVVRPVGGHLATLAWTMHAVYGMGPHDNNVWWAASDMGWVVGHSYVCYAPLTAGLTSVMYEGKPDRTPDPGQYFRVIEEHGVNALLTAPTALRVIKRVDPNAVHGKKYCTKSLKTIFVAGESLDQSTKTWAERTFKVGVVNHWWQTETGHSITATFLGLGHSPNDPPGLSTGKSCPGFDLRILRDDGSEAAVGEEGRIAARLPLPPGTLSTLYKNPEKFKFLYFSTFPGYYDTMDAGYVFPDAKSSNGWIVVTGREDDVVSVAGHRLSAAAIEAVALQHPDVGDALVVGIPDCTKGEVPLCLYVPTPNAAQRVSHNLINMVRELVGPIAAFRLAFPVPALPKTRSGKIPRRSIARMARGLPLKIPSTIENPLVYEDIKAVLRKMRLCQIK